MKILLIGGCGYIGSAIHAELSTQYHTDTVDLEWFSNYNNIRNFKQDFDTLSTEFLDQYDVIVHTAANSSVPLCKDIQDSFENNVTKVLRLIKKLKKQKFIYASSSCVYVTSTEPQVETALSQPMDGLTLSKTTLDNIMPLLDIEYYGLRFGSVNGWAPNMRTDLMINSMTSSAMKTGELTVTNGHAHRPIVSTQDLARAVTRIIQCPDDLRGIYNVASFNDNIRNIAQSVAAYTGARVIDRGHTGTYDFTISSEKFIKVFDFQFRATTESIVQSILDKPFEHTWRNRNSI